MVGHTSNDRSYIGADRDNKTETPRRGGEPKQNAPCTTRDVPRDQPPWGDLTTWSPLIKGQTRHMGTPPMGNPDKNHSKRSGHDLPSGHPNRGSLMPTDGDTLEGTLRSTPTRGDTERTGVRAQSVLRQAVTPKPHLGGGSMLAINPVRA